MVVAIIPRCGNAAIGHRESHYRRPAGTVGTVFGGIDRNSPKFSLGIMPRHRYLAANLYQAIFHTVTLQHSHNLVAAEAFCYSAEIELRTGVLLLYSAVDNLDLVDSDQSAQRIDLRRVGQSHIVVAKAPSIDQRTNSRIESAGGDARQLVRAFYHISHYGVDRITSIVVNFRNRRLGSKCRNAHFHAAKHLQNGVAIVAVGEILYVIFRCPNNAGMTPPLAALRSQNKHKHQPYYTQDCKQYGSIFLFIIHSITIIRNKINQFIRQRQIVT